MFKVICLALLMAALPKIAGAAEKWTTIVDLEKNWLTVDRSGEHYQPYVRGASLHYPVIGLMLDMEVQSGLVLECCLPVGTSIFINNKIIQQSVEANCLYFDFDSLQDQYDRKGLFMSFYHRSLNPNNLITRLLAKNDQHQVGETTENIAQVRKRADSSFTDFYIIAVLIILGFYAFLSNRHPKANRDFFNLSKAFSPTLKEEKILTQRNMSSANALFLWGHSMAISLVIILFWNVLGGIPQVFNFISLQSFGNSLISWLSLTVIVYASLGLKYLLIKTLCSLLNFQKIALIHFFDFMRLSMIFVSFTFLILTVIHFTGGQYQVAPYKIMVYVFIMLLGARILVLLLKLIAGSGFRKIHLISYLCTTEILPLLIGIRVFL